jgi:hypothetical protein
MSTTFISHRLYVAALNHESPAAPAAGRLRRSGPDGRGAAGRANELTIEQLAAFAARYWQDFPFAPGLKPRVS